MEGNLFLRNLLTVFESRNYSYVTITFSSSMLYKYLASIAPDLNVCWGEAQL